VVSSRDGGGVSTALPGPVNLLGLRIDVDTHDGMRDGVPRLFDLLAEGHARGTFYLSMGPDNSGRAIFNLLRPGFLAKMRRTGARGVYGWRTVLSGTLLPARMIALALPAVAHQIVDQGHEAGVHAWDHRTWQDRLAEMPPEQVVLSLDRGRQAFSEIFTTPPRTFAAPAWFSNEVALLHQETFGLDFATDCRGDEPFVPMVGGRALQTPQVPATLATLDEALGDSHANAPAFYRDMLDAACAAPWPVLTIHAELEGGPYAEDFARFLADARTRGMAIVPLGELLAARRATGVPLPQRTMTYAPVRGRHGVVFRPADPA